MNKNVTIDREKYIGGSEIATILGISKFSTRMQLLKSKINPEIDKFDGNKYTRYGQLMEPKIRDFVNFQLDRNFKEDTIIEEKPIISWRCNYDGLDKEVNETLEIKTTSVIHENVNDYKYYIVQLLWGMMLKGKDCNIGYLAIYKRPDDFKDDFDSSNIIIYTINRNDYQDWEKEILEAVQLFTDDLKKLKESDNDEILLPEPMKIALAQLNNLEDKMKEYKELTNQYEELKNKIYSLMKHYDIKSWKMTNGTLITRILPTEDSTVLKLNEKLLEQSEPEIFTKYLTQSVKKGKKGYITIKYE